MSKPERKSMLTFERVRERLNYDPETGIFTWAMDYKGGVRKGEIAGHEAERAADKARIAELEGVLADATREVEEWGAYASEYFQKKHDLAGTVARFRAALSQQGKEGER